jgi:hypothetical protein
MAKEQKGRPLPLDDPRRSFFPRRKRNAGGGDAKKGGNAGKAPTFERDQNQPYATRALPGKFKVNAR